jgi:hypothetical protein
MLKQILTYIIICSSLSSVGQTGTLKIDMTITDTVRAAMVLCFLQKEDKVINTLWLQKGSIAIMRNIPKGTYRLKLSAIGVRDAYTEGISINDGDTTIVAASFPGPCKYDHPKNYKPVCPYSHRSGIIKIVYGLPSAGMMEDAERGWVWLGGCEITGCDPKYYCKKHKVEF